MNPGSDRSRKERLMQMVDLAQVYRDCNRAELAGMLHRDPAKIIPESGNPKLDLVFNLADILDWPVGDVAEALWFDLGADDASKLEPETLSFVELNKLAVEAHRAGDHAKTRIVAQRMLRLAANSRERACAAIRMMNSLDQAGRYSQAIEWARSAASEADLPLPQRLVYLANLANSNYAAWNLHEAIGIAVLIERDCADADLGSESILLARAFAQYVHGSAIRRRLQESTLDRQRNCCDARRLFELAIDGFRELERRRGNDGDLGIAHTCEGAIIEVDVEAGLMPAMEAVQRIANDLEQIVDPTTHSFGDWLESWGWWAVFGLNIAVRHLTDESRERYAAIFSNKAHDIADRLSNWAIRERLFSLEHDLRTRQGPWDSPDLAIVGGRPWVLDREDIRNLLGTMGRFQRFRRIGWSIIRRAKFIEQ